MAYYSGSAASLPALRSALFSACATDGWTLTGAMEDILTKGGAVCRIQIVGSYLEFIGGRGVNAGALTGSAPNAVRIGAPGNASTEIMFPVGYEIFSFDSEVYIVINHSVDIYQWAGFGTSSIEGLPGTGMWLGATCGGDTLNVPSPLGITATGENGSCTSAALFWSRYMLNSFTRNYHVQHGLEAEESWGLDFTALSLSVGALAAAPLIGLLPNGWNSEAVLLPLRCYVVRPSDKTSLVVDLAHSRCTRIDNYTPGEVITIGEDRWKIFPWYRKNSAARNGGDNINHTGTFGWAIRYEGP